jgi:hypothetical protein
MPPPLDDHARLEQCVEQFALQQFIAQLAIEALVVPILPGAAGLDEQRLDADVAEPMAHGSSRELAAIV